MFLTKKHLSRRAVLKGMGATIALPFLDAMVPAVRLRAFGASARQARQPSRLVCIEMVHGAAGSSPWGLTQNLWAPAADRPGLRPGADQPAAARALPRPPHHHQQHRRAERRPDRGPRDWRRSFPLERHLPDAVVSQAHRGRRRRGRHLARPAVRAALRPGHADPVDAAVHRERRPVRRLRLRLLVRLHRRHQLGRAEQAAADDPRSARRVRSDVRRVRHRRDAGGAAASGAAEDRSILDWVQRSSAAARSSRSAPPTGRGSPTTWTTCARSSGASRRWKPATAAASRASCPARPTAFPTRSPTTSR